MTASLMAQETAEAPQAVARTLDANRAALAGLASLFRERRPSHLVTCARGSSDHAATYFKYLAEITLGIPCCSMGASVVSIYATPLRLRDALLVTISQSGRSPDLLAFQDEVRRGGTPTVAITNDEQSPLALAADFCLPLHAGPERSVAATKTFIASAALAAALVAACADDSRLGDPGLGEALRRLPEDLAAAAALRWDELDSVAVAATSLYVLGRGPALAMALEAALKLKETSGLHAEAFSAAEVMHGPMELVRQDYPILVFAPADAAAASTAANLARLAAAGARVLRPPHHATAYPALDPISMIQTFYASAERVARRRGHDPDAPRLLSKVTRTR